jgi:hypothetical protein
VVTAGEGSASLGIQEWEGVVEHVRGDQHFRARLDDLTRGGPPSWTDFAFSEVSPDDWHLVEPGAVFYWIVARRTNEARRTTAESFIHFRRLPDLTPREIEAAEADARRWLEAFGLE